MKLIALVSAAFVGGYITLLAAPHPAWAVPAAAASQTCQGEVIIPLDENGLPTGPATNVCTDPCAEGCSSYVVTIVGPNGPYDVAACGCSGAGQQNYCCQAVLSPPSSSGAGIAIGYCGFPYCPGTSSQSCVSEQGAGVGTAGPDEWGAVGKCKFVPQPR